MNHHRIWVNAEARQDILWWAAGLDYFHGATRFVSDLPPPHSNLVTDACRQSGGGYYESDWFFVNFSLDYPQLCSEHINVLELLSVLVAVRCWGHLWRDKHIQVRCDNSASVGAINKGSSRSPAFMRILREIFWLSVVNNFRFTAVHVRGEHNVLADCISRLHLPGFWEKFGRMFPSIINCFYCKNHMSSSSYMFLQEH